MRGAIGLVIAVFCTALAAGRAEAGTLVTFDIDVEIVQVGLTDDMGNLLGDFGFAQGDFIANAGAITFGGPDPDPLGSLEFDQVTAFSLSLDSASLSWGLDDLLEPLGYLGFVSNGEILRVVVPPAQKAGTSLETGRQKAGRKKATDELFNTVNIFDDQNSVVAEFTLRAREGAEVVPEPGAMVLFGTGTLLFTWRLRRRR
jgi:hypothetical protein